MKTPDQLIENSDIFNKKATFNVNDVAKTLKIPLAKLASIVLFDSKANDESKGVNMRRWAKQPETIPYMVYQRCVELLIANDHFQWTDDTAKEFVNWYIQLMELPLNKYALSDDVVVKSFKNGDSFNDWK